MEGGIVHGIGQKGRVIDYGSKINDLDSFEHSMTDISSIHLYVLKDHDIVEIPCPPSEINTILHQDKTQRYVVKEFLDPSLAMKVQGYTKKMYMLRELNGFKQILPLLKKHNIIGMPYKKTILFGFEIMTPNNSRCFVVNRKCKETLSESKMNAMSVSTFEKLVVQILTILKDIQKINLAHGDIKLDNIMKCNTYELIDWENSRSLDYDVLIKQRYLGLSPMYFKILYGSAWYPAFSIALLKYYRETGGYDTYTTSEYANQLIAYFSNLFQNHSTSEVFEKTKNSLDVATFGFILYGAMKRNPAISRYRNFIMNMYKMSAKEAFDAFKRLKTRKSYKGGS